MKKKFVQAESSDNAKEMCPWATMFVPHNGGYWCFESYLAYENWKKQ